MFNGEWRTYADALDRMGFGSVNGCYRGGCANYLRMGVTAAALLGDFDQDGSLDADDIDQLSLQLRTTPDNRSFDLNNDATLSQADREVWVHNLANTNFGDSNLDQEVDFSDFLVLSSGFGKPGGWGQGDFDGNGQIQFEDFLLLSNNYGQSAASVTAVPEPTSQGLLLTAIVVLGSARRKRRQA
jgi:hypothetical protein